MQAQDHILIVDDDAEIRTLLDEYLQKNGYRTTVAADGRAMAKVLETSRVDLIVLDLMLPGEDGLVLCRNLRARSDIPVLMLTARGDDMDRIVGLEMGADDYLPKPFIPRELLARIKGILRRTRALPPQGISSEAKKFRFSGWQLDTSQRHLISPRQVVVPLSGAEYRLLIVFLQHPNRVLNRDQLMDFTMGRESDPFDRSIDVQVSRLRHRLEDDAKEACIIKTIRGEGYLLAAEVEVEC